MHTIKVAIDHDNFNANYVLLNLFLERRPRVKTTTSWESRRVASNVAWVQTSCASPCRPKLEVDLCIISVLRNGAAMHHHLSFSGMAKVNQTLCGWES